MSRYPAAVTVTSLWGSRLILHCANNASLTEDEFYKQQHKTQAHHARQEIKSLSSVARNQTISLFCFQISRFIFNTDVCLCISKHWSRRSGRGVKAKVYHVRVEREVLVRWWTGGDDTWNVTVRARRLWRAHWHQKQLNKSCQDLFIHDRTRHRVERCFIWNWNDGIKRLIKTRTWSKSRSDMCRRESAFLITAKTLSVKRRSDMGNRPRFWICNNKNSWASIRC